MTNQRQQVKPKEDDHIPTLANIGYIMDDLRGLQDFHGQSKEFRLQFPMNSIMPPSQFVGPMIIFSRLFLSLIDFHLDKLIISNYSTLTSIFIQK